MFFPEHKDNSDGLIYHNSRLRRKSMIISMEAGKIQQNSTLILNKNYQHAEKGSEPNKEYQSESCNKRHT